MTASIARLMIHALPLLASALIFAVSALSGFALENETETLTHEITLKGVRATLKGRMQREPGISVSTVSIADTDDAPGSTGSASIELESAFRFPEMEFIEMDGNKEVPEVLVTYSTGGGHCCELVHVFAKQNDNWTELYVGRFDGVGVSVRDEDDDGVDELVTTDNAFLYRWSSYAESVSPPLVIGIRDGKIARVTQEPRYRKYLEGELKRLEASVQNEQKSNPWLAAHAALKLLLGDKDAFELADKDYVRDDIRGLTDCKVDRQQGKCPLGQEIFTPFPEDLRNFLRENGYLKEQQ